ncbi:MAG: hypothetical protein ACI8ZB_002634 [Desulforhopalus sp.]|jgi:hypothetical protein
MKYALIVMLAVYLVTFGCNPKSEEEQSTPQEKAEHASVEKAPVTPAAPENVHVTTETPAPAPPAELALETKATVQITPQASPANNWNTTPQEATIAPPTEVVVTAPPKAEEEVANQWKAIAQSAAITVLALMNDDTAQKAPKAELEKPAPAEEKAVTAETAIAEETATVLPCGKKMVQNSSASLPPCMKHGALVAQQPAAPVAEEELSEAMQKMVNATNDMVEVTRQLVMATQQMLTASRDVAVEFIDTGKEAIENSKPAIQNAITEEEMIETVREVVSATKEAYEATAEALSKALEDKEAQPAPEAAPQQ